MGNSKMDLSDFIAIQSTGLLMEVAADLKRFIDEGRLKQAGGRTLLEDILKFPPRADYVDLIFETIPEGTRYELVYSEDKLPGGMFRKL